MLMMKLRLLFLPSPSGFQTAYDTQVPCSLQSPHIKGSALWNAHFRLELNFPRNMAFFLRCFNCLFFIVGGIAYPMSCVMNCVKHVIFKWEKKLNVPQTELLYSLKPPNAL